MQLQKLGTERMQEIIEFDHLCFPNDFWKEEDWESLLRDERAIYYALLDDGRIVGDLFLYNWQGEQDYVKLMHISVHPDYRKQGLGERLMNHAQQEMKELGMGRFAGRPEPPTCLCRGCLKKRATSWTGSRKTTTTIPRKAPTSISCNFKQK